MTRYAKLLARLLSGTADRAFRFDDLCALLRRLGFDEPPPRRQSPHLQPRRRPGDPQPPPRGGGEAKLYQVRQVRDVVLEYGLAQVLAGEGDDEA